MGVSEAPQISGIRFINNWELYRKLGSKKELTWYPLQKLTTLSESRKTKKNIETVQVSLVDSLWVLCALKATIQSCQYSSQLQK